MTIVLVLKLLTYFLNSKLLNLLLFYFICINLFYINEIDTTTTIFYFHHLKCLRVEISIYFILLLKNN